MTSSCDSGIWASGKGVINQKNVTRTRIHAPVEELHRRGTLPDPETGYAILRPADQITNGAIRLVDHMPYARRAYTNGHFALSWIPRSRWNSQYQRHAVCKPVHLGAFAFGCSQCLEPATTNFLPPHKIDALDGKGRPNSFLFGEQNRHKDD